MSKFKILEEHRLGGGSTVLTIEVKKWHYFLTKSKIVRKYIIINLGTCCRIFGLPNFRHVTSSIEGQALVDAYWEFYYSEICKKALEEKNLI